ncbi:MAG: hypothetical protein J7M34_00060 [Anaerolineae bacterium]|nr:hypothetical protein [Anaerolineae bacterium]
MKAIPGTEREDAVVGPLSAWGDGMVLADGGFTRGHVLYAVAGRDSRMAS